MNITYRAGLLLVLLIMGCGGENQAVSDNAYSSESAQQVEKSVSGWIRYAAPVHSGPTSDASYIGHLDPPASVGVRDTGKPWLRLEHAPVKEKLGGDYLVDPDFGSGLFIRRSSFTTDAPYLW